MADGRKLFAVTQWMLRAGIIVTMLVIAWAVLRAAAMIFGLIAPRGLFSNIASGTGVTALADVTGQTTLAVYACGIAVLALVHFIFRALRRVVASASAGDPFIEANAVDLSRVAWLFLGVNVINALQGPALNLLAPAGNGQMHIKISITGLFAVLLLFVLAQIFRRGSDMRAELAETV